MMPRRRHLVAAAILLLLAQTPRALGAAPGNPPAFAVQTAGHGLRQYRSGSAEAIIVSDDTIKATVARVGGDEWELTLRPKRDAVTAVWFPWEPDKDTGAPQLDAAVVYYPRLLGLAVRASLLAEWGWQGGAYPGNCFAPLVVVADDRDARMVAATNWPPRRVNPMYSLGRIGLRYDEPLAPGARRSYRALVMRAHASADQPPWQRALDGYKAWLTDRMRAADLRTAPPEWMRGVHGWLNVQLQNAAVWDSDSVERTWNRWKGQLPWVQFWGQMSAHYVRGGPDAARTGCCLDVPAVHPRYEPDLLRLAHTIARDGRVGFYSRPRSPYAPLVGSDGSGATPDLRFLRAWLERNRTELGANAFYIDVLGHYYFGDPLGIAYLLMKHFDPATVIEYPVDVYPGAFLVSGSFGGGSWAGGPGRTPESLGAALTHTTAPAFGRYLLDDRVMFAGESNGDGRLWGPAADYWVERQAFLLGAKFDVMRPTEDGKPDGPANQALVAAIAARDRSGWWARDPVYLDRRGIGALPADVDVRRYRGRDDETLLVVDNWHERRGVTVEVDGRSVALPDERLAIVVVPRVT
jgi:hypothetical protein